MTNELQRVLETLDAYGQARESGAPDTIDTHTAWDAARLLREMAADVAIAIDSCESLDDDGCRDMEWLDAARAKWRLE